MRRIRFGRVNGRMVWSDSLWRKHLAVTSIQHPNPLVFQWSSYPTDPTDPPTRRRRPIHVLGDPGDAIAAMLADTVGLPDLYSTTLLALLPPWAPVYGTNVYTTQSHTVLKSRCPFHSLARTVTTTHWVYNGQNSLRHLLLPATAKAESCTQGVSLS